MGIPLLYYIENYSAYYTKASNDSNPRKYLSASKSYLLLGL